MTTAAPAALAGTYTRLQVLLPAGNAVRGFSHAVNLKEVTNFGDAETSPTQVTLSAGTWTGYVTVFRVDETPSHGAYLYVWLTDRPDQDGLSAAFNVHAGALARLQIVPPGQTA